MRRHKTAVIPHRRRREQKTDYRQRLRLLKAKKPRFIVRRQANSIVCQLVEYGQEGDTVLVSAHSGELKKSGWQAHTGNLPAAYLTGYLCGVRAARKQIGEAVLDLGRAESTKASGLYAAVKGVRDAGVQVPCAADILPPEDRLSGKHIADFAAQLKKENAQEYEKRFHRYLQNNLAPEELPKHVGEVKNRLRQ